MRTLLMLALLVAFPLVTFAEEVTDKIEVEFVRKATVRYILDTATADAEGGKHPLVIFLHGAGERGDDIQRVKIHGPHKYLAEHHPECFVVSPQCDNNSFWQPEALAPMIDHIVAKYPIDESRIYLTGLSMGGYGSWALAAQQPDRFAAVIPICGGGNPLSAAKLKSLPIWVFHGAKDDVVPPSNSQAMVDALKNQGSSVKFTLYPEANHDSWTETYNDPAVYEWLFAQRRPTE